MRISIASLFLIAMFGCADSSTETDAGTDTDSGTGTLADALALDGDAGAGEAVFSANCAACHGTDGTGNSGPNITGEDELDEIIEIVFEGEDAMPSFGDTLTSQEIADVAAYVAESL